MSINTGIERAQARLVQNIAHIAVQTITYIHIQCELRRDAWLTHNIVELLIDVSIAVVTRHLCPAQDKVRRLRTVEGAAVVLVLALVDSHPRDDILRAECFPCWELRTPGLPPALVTHRPNM